MINIIELGVESLDSLKLGTLKVLKSVEKVVLKTKNNEVESYLKDENINFEICDCSFNDDNNYKIVEYLILKEKEFNNIVYMTTLNHLFFQEEVEKIKDRCKEEKIELKVFSASNIMEDLIEVFKLDYKNGFNFIEASNVKRKIFDKRVENLISNIYNKEILEEIKNRLMNFYKENTIILIVKDLRDKDEKLIKIQLKNLHLVESLTKKSFLYIKKDEENKKDFNDLMDLVDVLRGENGCPWDIEQTNESIKNDTLEEAYELLEAINNKDLDNIVEELGDLLFHIVFHAHVGNQEKKFNINDVLESIINKMIFRHPHVFGDEKVKDSEEVLVNWEDLKKEEKKYKSISDDMKLTAKALPALIKARKIQKKAAKVGFDFDNIEDASKKVIEELNEVLDVYKTENKEKIYNEVGDLIFSCVNISRMLDVNEEEALSLTINKFIDRFSFIENEALKLNKGLNDMTLEEMNSIWERSKKNKPNIGNDKEKYDK